MMTFEELGVSKALTAVLNKRNITAPRYSSVLISR